jgi:hypothetical protein
MKKEICHQIPLIGYFVKVSDYTHLSVIRYDSYPGFS